MSKCISNQGEYGDHVLDQNFICKRCTALDEDALFTKVEQLSATIERVKAVVDECRGQSSQVDNLIDDIDEAIERTP